MNSVIEVNNLSYSYRDRKALDQISLKVVQGECFGLLGPNGGGKTTLLRILSTLFSVPQGTVSILGKDPSSDATTIRKELGVVFQSPSLDKKLTVKENLVHQGHLYGLSGDLLKSRVEEMLKRVALLDRANDFIEKLSGGLQRRVELAKSLLHQPKLILLDEPTVGLDPGARKDFWEYLHGLKKSDGITILVTTHLMEEAEKCDRLGIVDHGKMIALDRPDALRAKMDGIVVIVRSQNPEKLCDAIHAKYGGEPKVLDDCVHFRQPKGRSISEELMESFPGQIETVTIGKPSLEDVFVHLTGHRFWNSEK